MLRLILNNYKFTCKYFKSTVEKSIPPLDVYTIKQGEYYILFSPKLDLSSYGKSLENTRESFQETVRIFFEELVEVEEELIQDPHDEPHTNGGHMLNKEVEFYESNLDNWLITNAQKYVLIKDDRLIGFFDHIEDALTAGAAQFGMTSFLVRKVEKKKPEIYIPALTLGILNANFKHPI